MSRKRNRKRKSKRKRLNSKNTLMVLQPYLDQLGWWVFDDERTGLVAEPFVLGMSDMMDILTEDIPDAALGFNLVFSKTAFPGARQLKLMAPENGGNWYRDVETRMGGWLCPALFLYFDEAPDEIFVAALPKRGEGAREMKAPFPTAEVLEV